MRNFTLLQRDGQEIALVVQSIGDSYEVVMTKKLQAYFQKKACTCGMVPIPDMHVVILSGVDDCPVHGFGANAGEGLNSGASAGSDKEEALSK